MQEPAPISVLLADVCVPRRAEVAGARASQALAEKIRGIEAPAGCVVKA